MATLNKGSGSDGNITISDTKNINTNLISSGRTYADGVFYRLNALTSTTATTIDVPLGLTDGDEILLICIKGTNGNVSNVGNYEFLTIDSIVGSTITFAASKTKSYGDSGDSNISGREVIIQRVPNYRDVTIEAAGTITCSAWNSTNSGGVVVFRVQGTLTNGGSINANTKGFQAPNGSGSNLGYKGQSYQNYSTRDSAADAGGGGGGKDNYYEPDGSSYGTAGEASNSGGGPGAVYGEQTLSKIYLGSSGAGFGEWGNGGHAGGIVYIAAFVLDNNGTISSNGQAGTGTIAGGGTGGTGGSVRIEAGTLALADGTLSSLGYDESGHGRNAVYYYQTAESVGGSPTPYVNGSLELPPSFEISGYMAEDGEIRLYNVTTGVLIQKSNVTAGNYSIELTTGEAVDIVSRKTDGEIVAYGGVTPIAL